MTTEELEAELQRSDLLGHRVEIFVDGKLRLGMSYHSPVEDHDGVVQCLMDILEVLNAPVVEDNEIL